MSLIQKVYKININNLLADQQMPVHDQKENNYKSQSQFDYKGFDYQTSTSQNQNSRNSYTRQQQKYTDFSTSDQFFKDQQHQNQNIISQKPINQNKNQSNARNKVNKQLNQKKSQSYLLTNKQQSSFNDQLNNSQKKLTMNEFLGINICRQQYLKLLPKQQIQLSPQFKFLKDKNDLSWFVSISDYYEKLVPNEQFKNWIKNTRRNQLRRQIMFWSMIASIPFIYLAGGMNKLPKWLPIKSKNLLIFPFICMGGMVHLQDKNYYRSQNFFKEYNNEQILNQLLIKYICQTDRKERYYVYQNK